MAQTTKMATQTQVNCAADKLFALFTSDAHLMPKMYMPGSLSLQLIEGAYGKVGSVILWNCATPSGGLDSIKVRLTAVDEENKLVTSEVIGGEILKYYPDCKTTLQVCDVDSKTALVKFSVESKKTDEGATDAAKHMDIVKALFNGMAANLNKN